MSPVENQAHQEEQDKRLISRRQLFKVLIATGIGGAASTLLPCRWSKPVIEVGVLPAHAQASPTTPTSTPTPTNTPTPTSTSTPTPTSTSTPTPTPIPHIIILCNASDADGDGAIRPSDTLITFADISPPDAGIELRRTITLNEPGHPDDGVVDVNTGFTDATGRFSSPDFDLSSLSQPVSPGVDRVTVLWEFVDASDGTGTCERNIEIVP